MKKLIPLCLILCALFLCAPGPSRAEENPSEMDEWTVLIYLCGSDLESKYSYATGNLEEISRFRVPTEEYIQAISGGDYARDERAKVNVLIETGGAREWHADSLGMDVKSDRLQIWRYSPMPMDTEGDSFQLEKELPLSSMGDADTLAEFIRYGTETYPAKKTALVLWDHGGGAKTGIFIDELFDDDFMTLIELQRALREGGAQFELVLFDACLMANIETASAICDCAKWMVASEELVAGKGTAIGDWLQQLYYLPLVDGESLGHWICDMTQVKYANSDETKVRELITWSVVDLKEIRGLEKEFDALFEELIKYYKENPTKLASYCRSVFSSELYGMNRENMVDVAGTLFQAPFTLVAPQELQLRMQKALEKTVVYCVKGSGRPAARGLSFCFASNFTESELEAYSYNCPNAKYLALLDAISPWTAPERVYAETERLPDIETLDQYQIHIDRFFHTDGTPAFAVREGDENNVGAVFYNLYWHNPDTGRVVCLGTAPAYLDKTSGDRDYYRVYDLWLWPSIEGKLCQVEMLNYPRDGNYDTLFNIPIQMNSQTWYLRCGYRTAKDAYEVYGLWEGFDMDSKMFNRNVKALSEMAGREYRLLYEVDHRDPKEKPTYEFSTPMTMYRSLEVKEMNLPAGSYYLEYVLEDFMMRPLKLDLVQIDWDGKNMTVLEGLWQGSSTLNPRDFYRKDN